MDVTSIANVATLIGEAGRIRMLATLLDGNSHSASELAIAADASRQTASAHLSKLLAGGLVICEHKGRQRMFRLKSADVARAIEALGALAPDETESTVPEIRFARTCYDHLAGVLAIALRNQLLERGVLQSQEGEFALTSRGQAFFGSLGINAESLYVLRRSFAHKCLDWTERHHHIGGALGAVLLSRLLQRNWIVGMRNTRAVRVTHEGEVALERRFGVRVAELRSVANRQR